MRYATLIELRTRLEELDDPQTTAPLTIVLDLRHPFHGDLRALIRRRHPALRLILTSSAGRLPGDVTIGDLAASSGALGWRQIVFERAAHDALRRAVPTLEIGERMLHFLPEVP